MSFRHALLLLLAYVGYKALGEHDVLVEHLLAMRHLLEVEILSQGYETLVLLAECQLQACLLCAELGKSHAGVNRSAGIEGLLHVEQKLVAEVGRLAAHAVAEVAVGEQRVANVAEVELCADVGQALTFGCLYALAGCLYGCAVGLDTAVALVYHAEHLVDAQPLLGLCLSRHSESDTNEHRCIKSFSHICFEIRCKVTHYFSGRG